MSSRQPSMSCSSGSKFDEFQWVNTIRRTLEKEDEDDTDQITVSIFTVPKTLMSCHPDFYTPHQLPLGPYHYWRPDLSEMEGYKLSAAKNLQNQLRCSNFQDIVEKLIKLEPKIRACYHSYLNFNSVTLAWMMALDASFLLEFLQIYSVNEDRNLCRISSRMTHLLDYSKRKSAHSAILRDIVMMENQIPLFVLRKVLKFLLMSAESADDMLISMLLGLCKELSPFKMVELEKIKVLEHYHLLDSLYDIMVPRVDELLIDVTAEDVEENRYETEQENRGSGIDFSHVKCFLSELWNTVSELNIGPMRSLKNVATSATGIFKISWTILSNLLNSSASNNSIEPETESGAGRNNQQLPPLVEEIAIPSVTQLSNSGVRFFPTRGNISTINFDTEKAVFCLPMISLDANSEFIFRNLVAYELSHASGPMFFARYVELMNGIIDTEEDVRLLRERGIIFNHLKSDQEVANLWNGMSKCKSIRLTKAPLLDKVIDDVNKYYNSRWTVKIGKFMKHSVFSSWKFLTMLASILLLLLMAVESFCSVYKCGGIF
ncbi:hypothetical protein DKX38_026868 [Salix brachista]|uniref:Uncharacterized protein n=1 Tax=Salix brachista TaxID=2182728 RepID=A0A5N5JEL5_9ROSI|nr:hypothetical protein DKX38_026868 [Salix brachista]